MSERFFSAAELAALQLPGLPTTERGIRKRADAEGWPWRKRADRGGGREYPLSALPPEARAEIARRTASEAARAARTEAALVQVSEADRHAARIQALAKYGTSTGWIKAHIDARLAVLTAFKVYHATHGGSTTAARALFADAYNEGSIDVEPEVRAIVPTVSMATLLRWQTGFEKKGLQALAPRYGNRKGQCLITTQPELHDLVVGMLTQYPHCSVTHIMQAIAARCGDKTDLVVPKLRTVQRFISGWKRDNQQLYTAVVNPDKWRSLYQSAAGDAAAHVQYLNHEWQIDSTPGDVLLADGQRHTIIGVIDVWSRRLKLHVSRVSRASAIASLIRRALLDWGVPARIKSDNGQDYTAKHLKRIFAALDIEHVLCPPFSPEKKPFIERALGTVMHDIVELLPGFIGHNVAERKDIEARRSFAQRIMKGETIELRMTAEQLQQVLDDWCDAYHEREHAGLKGATPNSRVHGQRVRRIEDERALDILLQPVAGSNRDGWYTVTKKGVRIDRGMYNHAELGGREGTRVRALQDERDWGYIYLFDETGQFLCRAFDPERIGIEHTEVAIARRERQRRIIAEGKQAMREAKRRARIDNIVPDIMAHRAAAASNVIAFTPVQTHSTPALEQASVAARAEETPRNTLSDDLQQLQARLVEEQEQLELATQERPALAKVLSMTDGRGRWAFAKVIMKRVEAGEHVLARDLEWAQHYTQTNEYEVMESIAPDFQLTPDAVLLDLGVSV